MSHPRDGIRVDKLCHIVTNLELRHTGVTLHGPVLSLGNWSAMPTICWVFLLLLFWRKSGCSDPSVFIRLSAHGLTLLSRPYRLHSYVLNTHHFPCVAKRHGLATLLLLCGDISLNPGPISFGVVNCRSVRSTFHTFENISIAIGSAAQPLVLTCVYRPPGSCSESFLDQFLNLLEYLSSVSPSFLICGDFNIHVDTSSNDSIKFQKF